MYANQNDFLVGSIDMEPNTGRKIVPVFLLPIRKLTTERVLFKLDSGADLTFMDKTDLFKLKYSMEWINKNKKENESIKIRTADGTLHNGTYIQVPLMTFMDKDFHNFKIYIIPDENEDFSNLLGLNVSTQFNYYTNNSEGTLEFYRIEESKFNLSDDKNDYIVGENIYNK